MANKSDHMITSCLQRLDSFDFQHFWNRTFNDTCLTILWTERHGLLLDMGQKKVIKKI